MGLLTDILGKRLFPRLPRDLRERRLNNLLTVLFISLVVMGGIVFLLIIIGKNRG
jgi:hypothetical protein